jgi:predicted permease
MYIALFSALAYVMLRKVSIRLFESIVQVQVVRVKAFRGFRVRGPLMALVRVDLVQSFRSRIAGLWALPISFWLIMFFAIIISGVKLTPMSVLAYVWQMSLVIAFIPFILYTSELRGAVVFRLLPISPIRNLVSKLIVTLIAYYVAVAPMMIMALLYRMPLSLQVPILLAFGPPMVATAVMAILFEKSISEGAMPSILTMFIYGLMVILAEGLPDASLIVALVLIGGYVIPALVMFAVSMIEFVVALVVLVRLGRH